MYRFLIPIALACAVASGAPVYSNGSPDQSDGSNISGFVAADDFNLLNTQVIGGLTIWASANVDPFSQEFSGVIGWAILQDILGQPGGVLFSGATSSIKSLLK